MLFHIVHYMHYSCVIFIFCTICNSAKYENNAVKLRFSRIDSHRSICAIPAGSIYANGNNRWRLTTWPSKHHGVQATVKLVYWCIYVETLTFLWVLDLLLMQASSQEFVVLILHFCHMAKIIERKIIWEITHYTVNECCASLCSFHISHGCYSIKCEMNMEMCIGAIRKRQQ